jgi:hypothetical protein
MSWLYSQALVEEYSEATCLDGEPFAAWNGTPMQQAYCSPDKMTDVYRLSRFGMTFKPLTEDRGEELLMLYLEDFRVRTLAAQEKEQELPERVQECGRTWRGSLAKYDPDTHLLRTAQCSLLEDSIPSSVTLPRWGTMRNGDVYQQPIVARPTKESEFGLWPTPTAHNAKEGAYPAEFLRKTPTLAAQVQIKKWPTPQASDNRDRGNISSPSVQRRIEIGKQVSLSQSVSTESGQLNPMWVEWLMGWPLGWTDLQPLAMARFQEWLRWHGGF